MNGDSRRIQKMPGRLEIGDISLAVAVGSPHREAAFRTCAQVVDRIKQTVPILKSGHINLTPIGLIVRVPLIDDCVVMDSNVFDCDLSHAAGAGGAILLF